jgi:signal transduction histidine kinase
MPQSHSEHMTRGEPRLGGVRERRVFIALLTVAAGLASVLLVPHSSELLTTYSAGSGVAHAADVVAGLSLLAAGLAALIARPRESIGTVAMLAGAAWFAPDWVGWEGGEPLVRSTGMVVAPFVPSLLVHIALAPHGRFRSVVDRAIVVALYVVAAVTSLALALFRDPFLDQYCWSNCTQNVLLVQPQQQLARLLQPAFLLVVLVGAMAVIALLVLRFAHAKGVARRGGLLEAMSGVFLVAAQAAYAGALLRDRAESADDTMFATLFLLRAGTVTLIAVTLGWSAYVVWRTRSAVARLALELGEAPAPGSLRTALATSLGDPDVEVAYPIGASERFVDAAGNVVAAPFASPGGVVTPIIREGRRIAVVVHSRGALVEEELAREIGAAARLAVENERLQAELLAQLNDLRASRTRIVETGDAARRLLERDLHDGAQQRLLALSYDLRVASSAARAEGEEELAVVLDSAVDEALAALDELRELAHGIFPAILAEAGLGPSLWGLVDQASIPVELTEPGVARYPPAVETAAYVVADDAIADAARRTATHALVRVWQSGKTLVVEIEDDGGEGDLVPEHLADRVGALDGRLARAGHVLRTELPCA